jgi:hypothetical protein
MMTKGMPCERKRLETGRPLHRFHLHPAGAATKDSAKAGGEPFNQDVRAPENLTHKSEEKR